MRTEQEVATCKPGRELSAAAASARTLILDFQPQELKKKKNLLPFKSLSLWLFVRAAAKDIVA